ncbi:MAG: GntR family transcriptional regulator [Firmicutes bacterium HGW-Firmicutes-11]|jgi:DNA-binding GntR family transcriptional regulator|nr:MAG: GntR family transcriptional regulator [Firmicutes bacterium HGW-Firmicutes-11]
MNSETFPHSISLAEEIETILRERILHGEYGIGERIKESQVAEELAVSRTPIREALRQLEQKGLVQSIPNRGSFALGFTRQDIGDIYTVRAAVEAIAVGWAAERISAKELTELEDVFEKMEFFTERLDSKRVSELNKDFHKIIYNATGSRFLAQILRSYQDYVEQTRKATVYCKENLMAILSEHGDILEALRKKDKDLAVERIAVHLENSRKRAELSLKL